MTDQRAKTATTGRAAVESGGPGRARAAEGCPGTALLRLAGILAGVCGVGVLLTNCGAPEEVAGFSDPGEWRLYKSRFITPEGRVLDTANGDITHSEGIGYALLLATHFDDRETFDRIWAWSVENLRVREDGLFAWRWQPTANEGAGGVDDINNAADGDVLIAWALLRATDRWDVPGYRREAMGMMGTLRDRFTRMTPAGTVILPGQHGFEHEDGSLTINPSYWVFPAFEEFARTDETTPQIWEELTATGIRLIDQHPFRGVTSDWLKLDPVGKVMLPETSNFPAEFGYNAVRVPLYLAWAGFGQRSLHEGFANFPKHGRLANGRTAATLDLRSGQPGKDPAMDGAVAIFEISRAFAENREVDPAGQPRLSESDAYFSASLLLLSKMALDERFGKIF